MDRSDAAYAAGRDNGQPQFEAIAIVGMGETLCFHRSTLY